MDEAVALVERVEFGPAPAAPQAAHKVGSERRLRRREKEAGGGPEGPGLEPGLSCPVVVGFRREGRASVYFGGDPVYHFDTAGRLRRALAGGKLYKAERSRLVEMVRRRTPSETQLVSRVLGPDEETVFLRRMHGSLRSLLRGLDAGMVRVLRQVPAEADVAGRARALLAAQIVRPPRVAPDVRSR